MSTEVFEQDNRRAEIDGAIVTFLRISGDLRRSMFGVWWTECPDQAKEACEAMGETGKTG